MNNNYVFDLVITEDSKYMIFMDEVFINKSKFSLGSIWDNTHIFTEILNRNIPQSLNESIKRDLNVDINKIQWKKNDIVEWLNELKPLLEQGIISQAFSKTNDFLGNTIKSLFMKGVVPALRWYRKNTTNLVGTAVDAFFSLFPYTAPFHKGVWIAIVVLDIYEMINNDYDEVSKDSPIINLIGDIATLAFSRAAKSVMNLAKGVKLSPKLLQMLESKLPSLFSTIKQFTSAMAKSSTSPTLKNFTSKTLGGMDGVFKKVMDYIKTSQGKQVVKGTAINTGISGGLNLALTGGVMGGIKNIDTIKKNNAINYLQDE